MRSAVASPSTAEPLPVAAPLPPAFPRGAARAVYTVMAVLFGAPSLLVGGPFACMALLLGLVAVREPGGLAALAAGLGGMAGLLAWALLSWRYWRQGGGGLRQAPAWLWLALLAGCAAAVALLVSAWADVPRYIALGGWHVALLAATVLPRGPLLLPLAAFLAMAALAAPARAARAAIL